MTRPYNRLIDSYTRPEGTYYIPTYSFSGTKDNSNKKEDNMNDTVIGLKRVTENNTSACRTLTNQVVEYPFGKWIRVPGNGSYVTIGADEETYEVNGINAGGKKGQKLIMLECDVPTNVPAPPGVECFRFVKRINFDPEKLTDNLEDELSKVPNDMMIDHRKFTKLNEVMPNCKSDEEIEKTIVEGLENGAYVLVDLGNAIGDNLYAREGNNIMWTSLGALHSWANSGDINIKDHTGICATGIKVSVSDDLIGDAQDAKIATPEDINEFFKEKYNN